jgi:hypothetical protein
MAETAAADAWLVDVCTSGIDAAATSPAHFPHLPARCSSPIGVISSKLTWTILREAHEQLEGLVPLQACYMTA